MTNGYNIFLTISVIFHLPSLISAGYLHGEYDANLIDRHLNFSLYITKSPGMILYAIDTNNNKVLITIENKNNMAMLIIKFNTFMISIKKDELSVCDMSENIYLQFILQLRQEKIILKCRNSTKNLQLIQKDTDQITGYPIPTNFNQYFNKTFIWMGNTGPYTGRKYVLYKPLIHQLLGCLDNLFYDGVFVKMNEYGEGFQHTCNIQYVETKCYENDCKKIFTVYKVYQCSIEVINGRHCKQDLKKFDADNIPYHIKPDFQNKILLRLEWKEKQSNLYKEFSLLEIQFIDENVALFSINSNGDLKFIMRQQRSGNSYKKFSKTLSNQNMNKILLITFQYTELMVKVSNYTEIFTFYLHPMAKPKLVNVGVFRHVSGFSRFEGEINFQHNLNQFRSSHAYSSTYNPTIKINSNKRKWIFIILVIGIGLLVIPFITFLIINLFKQRSKKNVERKHMDTSNRSSPNHYEFEMNSSSSKETGEKNYETIPNDVDEIPNLN